MVLGLALALRWTTLDVPHFYTDEPWCEGLAASLLATGAYSVQHTGFTVLDHREPGLALLELGPDPRERGAILEFYATDRQDPLVGGKLSARAPLFSALLAASVAASGDGKVRVVAVNDAALGGRPPRDAYATAAREPRPDWRRAQLPAVLPSLLASLATVLLAWAAARSSASPRGALVAAFAIATAPLDVWCAHRVTADTLTAATVGAVALAAAGAAGRPGRRGLACAALAGALGGLAFLAKSSGALVVPAFALAEALLLVAQRRRGERGDLRGALVRTAVLGGVLALAGLWWPLVVFARSGELARSIGYGGVGLPEGVLAGAWPTFTRSRAFWVIPATTAVLSPLLGLGLVGLGAVAARAVRVAGDATERERTARALVHACTGAAFLAVTLVWPSKENRFLLPAYVPLAVGAALATDAIVERARRHFGPRAGVVVVALGVAALALPAALLARHYGPSGAWEIHPLD